MARPSTDNSPAIQHLTRLRAQILQLAVSGELVPQDEADEPASVLLERIANERERLVTSKQIKSPPQPGALDDAPYELPPSWRWARLGNLISLMDSGWSPQCIDRPPNEGEWAILKTTAVNSGRFSPTEAKTLPNGLVPRSETSVVDGDYVLTRGSGSVEWMARGALIANPPDRLMLSDLHIRLRFIEPSLRTWWALAAVSRTVRTQLEAGASGTSTMRKVSKAQLRGTLLPVPPAPEQRRIVARVDELMAAIDELEAYLRRVEALRPQILQLAVQGELVPQDPSDEPASAFLDRVASERARQVTKRKVKTPPSLPQIDPKEVPFGLPSGWRWIRLGQVSTLIRGVTYKKEQAQPLPFERSIPLLRGHNIGDGVEMNRLLHVPESVVSEDQMLRTNDIVLTMSSGSPAHVGKVARISQTEPLTFGAFCGVVRPVDGLAEFLEIALAAPYARRLLMGASRGIGINNLRAADLTGLLVPLPPLAEQRQIVTKVGDLLARIDSLQCSDAPGAEGNGKLVDA